ncbi:glycine betaine/proline transport system substrate-binding protein [Shimia isoporae]|uniref:Glycine betaine/proline transport system substrate-binding protein n=1 Tax=Shimia isoporae TaxID=647720 RepID=A0A4R1N3B8_9RHOB|nr:glycine betaine ABC transporter substrate-binding protein [Shimia isoporae]TCL01188.1 glycine betaine/proline transport system substrate-binding protein [Shimia isoporae]
MKTIKTTVALAALVAAAGSVSAQEKITFSDLSWNGAQAIGHVLSAIIEDQMGGDAEIVSGMNQAAVIMAGMDKGDGSIDVFTDLWMPNQQALWDEYIDGNGTVVTNSPYKGTSNIYVPSYMRGTVDSIDDLRNPEVAAMFDTDGNGKGEYWAGDVTWASTKRWQIKFKSYGLDGLWEPNIVSADTFKAGLEAAYTAEKPQLFYYWTPEAIHVKYDLVAVKEPARSEGCEDVNLDAEDWLEVSEFNCVIASNDIYVAYSKSLETRNPPVAKMLSNVQFTGDEINAWIVEMFENKRDPREVAEDWIADNMKTVQSWIDG